MKKIVAVMLLTAMLTVSGCNYKILDTNYNYDRAMIGLPDGTIITGEVDSWRDFEDGDQIEVEIDGTVYLAHSSNVVLIKEV